jgi:tetratricopeptide (TPR) repeat protein
MVGLERSDDTFEPYDVHNSRQLTQEQWLHKGLDYYNGKQYLNALGAFEQAAQLDSNSVRTYYCISLAQFMLGFYSEALAALDKAIQSANMPSNLTPAMHWLTS